MDDKKWWFEKKFHERLANILQEEYGITVEFSSLLSWGYSTTTYYIKTKNQEYTAKLSKASEEKLAMIGRDFMVGRFLHDKIPTTKYVKNKQGDLVTYIKNETDTHIDGMTLLKDSFLRVCTFTEGVIPFELNLETLSQMVTLLKIIHQQNPAKLDLPGKEGVLLHGDFTPSNVLVSFGKVVAVLDFENAMIGPREWDLASIVTFSWFLLPKYSFDQILKKVLEIYGETRIDQELIKKLAKVQLNNRIKNILNNEKNYESSTDWKKDLKHTKTQLLKIDHS